MDSIIACVLFSWNPLGRNIRVEEVVPAIEYLLSDAANVVTGQNIGVTGG